METLTKKQAAFLSFVTEWTVNHGKFPSYQIIREHFGFKSNYSVSGYIQALEKKGRLERRANSWIMVRDSTTWKEVNTKTWIPVTGYYWIYVDAELDFSFCERGKRFEFTGFALGPIIAPEPPIINN